MKKIILFLSITIAAGLLLTNIYNSIVDAVSWSSDFPRSIQSARNYFHAVNPGVFFRIFSPANLIISIFSIIIFFKNPGKTRVFLLAAFLFYLAAEVMTFAYFYPRNAIIFMGNLNENADSIKDALRQWDQMNWVRSFVLLIGLMFSFKALDSFYKNSSSADSKFV